MTDWRYVGCPNCHLNRFSVKTRREIQAVQQPTLQKSQSQKITTFQIECQNCRHVLVRLGRAEG